MERDFGGRFEKKFVAEIDGHHDAAQSVQAVVTPLQHFQREVEFRGRAQRLACFHAAAVACAGGTSLRGVVRQTPCGPATTHSTTSIARTSYRKRRRRTGCCSGTSNPSLSRRPREAFAAFGTRTRIRSSSAHIKSRTACAI